MQKPTLTPATPRWQTGLSLLFVLTSVALFVASLPYDGFSLSDGVTWGPSWLLLLLGWSGVICGTYAWFANPLLLVAWCLIWFRPRVVAASAACIALLLALSFLLHEEILVNAADRMARIVGYWLWIASISTATIGCLVGASLDRLATKPVSAKPIVQHPSAFDEPPPVWQIPD